MHAHDTRPAFSPGNFRPPAARPPNRRPELLSQLENVEVRGEQGILASAVLFVAEKCGMNYALSLQPHKVSMIVLGGLIDPGNAGRT